MRVTVKDVAKEAGCSSSLVSFYLNHPNTTRVAAATRKRIDCAVEKLHYRPNLLASILKSGGRRVVGVLIDSEAPDATRRLLPELEREACRRKLYLQIGIFHNDLNSLRTCYTILKQYGACGVICLSHDYPQFNQKLEEQFAAMSDLVFYNSPERTGHPCLIPDVAAGIQDAFLHLKAKGYKRIALCIQQKAISVEHQTIQLRLDGYNAVAGNEALPVCRLPEELSLREAITQTLPDFLKSARPDALLMENDRHALCAMQFLLSCGIRIPHDLAIFGFDDDPQSAESTPPLSTVSRDNQTMAEQLFTLLFNRISPDGTIQTIYSKPNLLIRSSG